MNATAWMVDDEFAEKDDKDDLQRNQHRDMADPSPVAQMLEIVHFTFADWHFYCLFNF